MRMLDPKMYLHGNSKSEFTWTQVLADESSPVSYIGFVNQDDVLIVKSTVSGDETNTLFACFRNSADEISNIWYNRYSLTYVRFDLLRSSAPPATELSAYFDTYDPLITALPTTSGEAEKGDVFWNFTRANTATFEDVDGVVQTAAIDTPRFGGTNYNSTTKVHSKIDSSGVLIPSSPAITGGIVSVGDSQANSQVAYVWYLSGLLSQSFQSGAVSGAYLNKNSPVSPADFDIVDYYDAISYSDNALVLLEGGHNDLKNITDQTSADRVLALMKESMTTLLDDATAKSENVMAFEIAVSSIIVVQEAIDARVAYNIWLKAECATKGATYLEINYLLESATTAGVLSDHTLALDAQTVASDLEHWNTLGHRKVAEYIFMLLDRKFLKGCLMEGDATNIVLHSNDFSHLAWTKTNCTETLEAELCPDGVTPCYSVKIDVAGGSITQAVTMGASHVCFPIWVKRKTGTGRAFLTLDGTKGVSIPVTSEWKRFYINTAYDSALNAEILYDATTLNPVVGLIGETLNDEFYIAFAQVEEREFSTSYIPTVASSVQSLSDNINMPTNASFWDRSNSTLAVTMIPLWCTNERYADRLATNDNYLFSSNVNVSFFSVYHTNWIAEFRRFDTNSLTSSPYKGFRGYSLLASAEEAGQRVGGSTRNQVIPLCMTTSWATGENAVLKNYCYGGEYTTTSIYTSEPRDISILYFNRLLATNTAWFFGYMKEFYLTKGQPPEAILKEVSNEAVLPE